MIQSIKVPRPFKMDGSKPISFIYWFFYLFLGAHHLACWILVLWPGIEPVSPAVEAWILKHWTAREVLKPTSFKENALSREFLSGPVVRTPFRTPCVHCWGSRVWSLVEELGPHQPPRAGKRKKVINKSVCLCKFNFQILQGQGWGELFPALNSRNYF